MKMWLMIGVVLAAAVGHGHSIGLHGFKHQFAPDVVAKLGEDGYIADEIEPQLSAAESLGVAVVGFDELYGI